MTDEGNYTLTRAGKRFMHTMQNRFPMSNPPSQRDIARAAGVSQSTASRALRGDPSIPQATALRVRQAAQKLGYKLNLEMTSLMRQVRSKQVGQYRGTLYILANTNRDVLDKSPTHLKLIKGFEDRAAELGYTVETLFPFTDYEKDPERVISVISARGGLGIAFLSLHVSWPRPFLKSAVALGEKSKLKGVLIGVTGTALRTEPPQSINTHYEAGGRLAARHCLDLGYRKPFVYPHLKLHGDHRAFWDGFVAEYLRSAGIPLEPQEIHDPLKARQIIRRGYDCGVLTNQQSLDEIRAILGDFPVLLWEAVPDLPDVAGLDHGREEVGAAAVDVLVSQIYRGLLHLPEIPSQILVIPTWHPGSSLPDKTEKERRKQAYPLALDAAPERFQPLDLSGHFNTTLHTRPSIEWLTDGTLQLMPSGRTTVHGVPFDLPEEDKGRECLVLSNPDQLTAEIPLAAPKAPARLLAVYLLHCAGYASRKRQFGQYRLLYEDGQTSSLPLITLGEDEDWDDQPPNIQDWHSFYPQFSHGPAKSWILGYPLSEPRDRRAFYTLEWKNPRPDKPVKSLLVDLSETQGERLAIFAITLLRETAD